MSNNKKIVKELTNTIVEVLSPYMIARDADIKEEVEEIFFKYFTEVEVLDDCRVRNVRIEETLLGKKVIVDYSNNKGEFFSKSYSYDKVFEKANDKKMRDVNLYVSVLDRYSKAAKEINKVLENGQITQKNIFLFRLFCQYSSELNNMHIKSFLSAADITKIKMLDTKLKVLADEIGLEIESSENLYEKSIRNILEKGATTLNEGKFLLAAIDYLDDELDGVTHNATKFSKLPYDEKIRMTYHYVLHCEAVGYYLSSISKSANGRMVNKLFTENKQSRLRKDRSIINKVLSDEELTSDDYRTLIWMSCDYNDISVDTVSCKYALDDIREKIQVYKKLLATESKDSELFEKRIRKITDWERLMNVLCGDKEHIKDNLSEFAEELFEREIAFVDIYTEGYDTEFYVLERKDEFDRIKAIFEKMLEYFDSVADDNSSSRGVIERYLDVTNRNLSLFNITKKFKYFMNNDKKCCLYDYIDGVLAYYMSFDKEAKVKELSISNNKLKRIVDLQKEIFEKDLSVDLLNDIRKGTLEVPKRYFKENF